MTVITIREQGRTPAGYSAAVSFDHQGEYAAAIANPFSEAQETELEWYFEQHLRFPFTDQVRAREVAAGIPGYGERLFRQVFADREAFALYKAAAAAGLETLRFEVAGSFEFHALHWEALKDPAQPQPLAVYAPILRKTLTTQPLAAVPRPSPTINLLIVTARPAGRGDVGYRTISRPLIESLRQADLRVRAEILRPGSYKALVQHLEEVKDRHGAGYYHVIHFDVHGALLTFAQYQKGCATDRFSFQSRYGRADLAPTTARGPSSSSRGTGTTSPTRRRRTRWPGSCSRTRSRSPCSTPASRASRWGESETSLGSRLMQAGVQSVLSMGYSVTVSAAELMMSTLYDRLFAGHDLAAALRRARWSCTTARAAVPTTTRPSTWRTGSCRSSTRTAR
jgi:hypothetical protein